MLIEKRDREILREMAKRQMALATSEPMKKLYREWEAFGSKKPASRAMVRIELGTFAEDIIPQLMRCTGEDARKIEWMMHGNVVNHTLFGDDTLVRDHIGVPTQTFFIPFGLPDKRQETRKEEGGGLGHHFISQISTLEEDFHKLGKSTFGIDLKATQEKIDDLNEIFGDILPVYRENSCAGASPMQNIIHLMDMEDMYIAMMDEAELFHKVMTMLSDDYVEYFKLLESSGVLLPTNKDQHLYQGSYCFTEDLPGEKENVKLMDTWVYLDSQETAGVSPQMYREFVVPYYKKISSLFGLLSYGCCEAVNDLWEGGIDQYENVRKVSISPWTDQRFMGDVLRGTDTVFLRKPTPNLLGVGDTLDEDAVSQEFQNTADLARGCKLEIAQRDVYQVSKSPEKVRRYVEIIRRETEKHYQPT